MLGGKKHQFYVQFLGWVETAGLRGARYTDPVVNDLRQKAKKWKYAPKLTLQVSKKELKITQDVQDERKKGKTIKTIKFPIIPSRDITYAYQAPNPNDGLPDDIVACIYLGYVPRTQRYLHVHVYRFDSAETATTFVRFLNQIISMNAERTNQIEQQLIEQGHVENPRSIPYSTPVTTLNSNNNNPRFNSSDGMSDRPTYEDSAGDSNSFSDEGFPSGSDDIDPDLQSLKDAVPFDSVTDELKSRLNMKDAPLLLPPKDYDTVVRRHGDLTKAERRKCLQIPIVGQRNRNTSDESGIEVPSPTNSEGKNGSMDISGEKVPSLHSHLNEISSPILSSRNEYDIYPPKSPSTPTQRDLVRSRPNSSRSSANYSDQNGPSVSYNNVTHVTEIPPADYDDNLPVMRNKTGMFSARDLTKSMPASSLQREMEYGYSVLPSRLNRHSSNAKYSDRGLSPRGNSGGFSPHSDVGVGYGRTGIRRVNSMYR